MLEQSDLFVVSALEWVYDKVEKLYGTLAAWLVTLTLGLMVIAAVIALLIYLL